MKLTTRVYELDPDWLLICFKGPRPSSESRAFWFQRTLRDYLGEHPDRHVRRVEPIQDNGELLGLHVWLESAPKPGRKKKLPVSIHHKLFREMQPEHVEALLHYAYDIFFRHKPGSGVLAVVSRGGKVVLFDRSKERCYIAPLAELQNLPADALAKIRQWQSEPTTPYFSIELGGFETP